MALPKEQNWVDILCQFMILDSNVPFVMILSKNLWNWCCIVSKKHEGKEPFNCSICNVTFLYKEDLKKHACVLHDDKPFKCSECDLGFAKKVELKRHINSVHDGKKTFKCSICDCIFTKKVELNRHLKKTHEGKKPFNCSTCNVSFLSDKTHVCVNQDDKPFNWKGI